MSESLTVRSEGPDGKMAGWLVERWRQRRVDLSADGGEEHTTRLRLPPHSWRGRDLAARCPSALCTILAHLLHRVWLVHHLEGKVEREQLVVGVGASSTTLFLLWMELLGVSRTDPEQVYRVERQGVTRRPHVPCPTISLVPPGSRLSLCLPLPASSISEGLG